MEFQFLSDGISVFVVHVLDVRVSLGTDTSC